MNVVFFQFSLTCYFLALATGLVFFFRERKRALKASRLLFGAAFALHTLGLAARAVGAGYPPFLTLHENLAFFAWALALCFLSLRFTVKNLDAFICTPIFLLMLAAAIAPHAPLEGAPVSLRALWFSLHAGLALLAYGFFALAGAGGAMYLLQEHSIKQKRFGFLYHRLPSLESLDRLNQHCLALGFPLLTLGMVAGSLWARQAYGVYWSWNPAETWALLTWLFYATLVHQRFTVGWRGRRAAWLSIAAFLAAIFTFWGVSALFAGYHGVFF